MKVSNIFYACRDKKLKHLSARKVSLENFSNFAFSVQKKTL